jgi:Hint domain
MPVKMAFGAIHGTVRADSGRHGVGRNVVASSQLGGINTELNFTRWERPMKKLQHIRTRRQLFRLTAVSAASIPFLALARKSASAQNGNNQGQNGNNQGQNNNQSHPCFLKGTKVSTPSGDRLVQDLQIGDEVQTLTGRKTIKWIGYNKFTKEEGRAWQDSVMPIRVARFAIDDHTPHRDLYLSPGHCIFFNESLIPVMYLINEASIAQGMPSDMSAIEYFHVELDTHEVIYAEGALVESFDGASRENFSNFVQYERLYGVEHQSEMTPFAPILRYRCRRQELKGLVRSLISNVVDVRDPIQIASDQLAQRAEAMLV